METIANSDRISLKAILEVVLTGYHGFVASRHRYGIFFWANAIKVKEVFRAQKNVLEKCAV